MKNEILIAVRNQFLMIVAVCARLQELIKVRNLEQKHEPMKSLLLDIDFRSALLISWPMYPSARLLLCLSVHIKLASPKAKQFRATSLSLEP